MRIQIETIPHRSQRYETTGDWWWDPDDTLQMRVSTFSDWRHSALIAFHEFVEALLCKAHGVTAEAVDAWDTGPGKELADPGDDPRAPYHREHNFALSIERLFAHELGVDWNAYGDALDALYGARD
jgi:hypothetical protein